MRLQRTLGWAAAVLAVGVAAALASIPAPEGQRRVAADYDLFVGGLRLAEARVEARIGRLGYEAEARLGAAGVAASLFEVGVEARATGRRARDRLIPRRFEATARDSRKTQRVAIRYEGERPAALEAEPPFKPKPWEIDPARQSGAPDPLTGLLMAMAPPPGGPVCGREIGVFDGRRRYALVLGEARESAGGAIRCEARYRRIAGFRPRHMKKPDLALTLWFDRGGDGPRLLRAMADTPLGTAVLRRRDAG